MRKLFFLILTILFFYSCSTTKPQPEVSCITSELQGFSIEFGYDYGENASQDRSGYILEETGKISLFVENRQTKKRHIDSVCTISKEEVCDVLQKLKAAMLKVPTQNEPGERRGFIFFHKPAISVNERFFWNAHGTPTSTPYRDLYNDMMQIISVNK